MMTAEHGKTADARKGRGAVSNASGRYERFTTESFDDGWVIAPQDWEPTDGLEPLRTSVTVETAKSIIAHNTSPDIPFDQSINPYRGCEHGCVYCYARPAHAYVGLSPGQDFESRLFVKPNAAELLARELSRPGYKPSPIMLGANTDPYQPIERDHRITREILEVLDACSHPVGITTKSANVLRDVDILARMASRNLVAVGVSITTLDPALARIIEPRAATPAKRLAAIRALSEAGVPVTLMAAPMIPHVNDMELEALLQAGADAGARLAAYILLRLPLEVRDLFAEWLTTHFPDRKERVLAQVRETRGGRDYDPTFGQRMTGRGVYAELLNKRFKIKTRQLGLNRAEPTEVHLDTSLFVPPVPPGGQMRLF
ncbi:MAG: PA0069 family radical SAM protein [Rhodospirillales bacterium]